MLRICLVFLSALACVSMLNAQVATCPNLENDIDYNGNDISFAYAVNTAQCCQLCTINPLCRSFTFVTASQTCWLKSTVGLNRIAAIGRKL